MSNTKFHLVRRFKVACVSTRVNSFGLHGHILIAESGEAWEVARSRGKWHSRTPFNKGDVVNVSLRQIGPDPAGYFKLVPTWENLSCEIPRHLPDAPESVVREIWA